MNETEMLDLLIAKALREMIIEAVVEGLDEPERQLLAEIRANPNGFLRVREAALVLQVATLQNADRRGNLSALRHPLTGRRLYRRSEIDDVIRKCGRQPTRARGPAVAAERSCAP